MTNPLKQVINNLNRLHIDKSSRYLLAFSGGPDSVFLLTALIEYGIQNLELIYVNYNDSPQVYIEHEIVLYYAKKYNLELNRLDLTNPLTKNFEAEARVIRYNYFKKYSAKSKIKNLFVAHQKTDLLETYLLQKRRNSVVSYYGLKEINNQFDLTIIRPMLNITKDELIKYLDDNNIRYYDDITNTNMSRQRNYIRKKELPYINEYELCAEIEQRNKELEEENSLIDEMIYSKKIDLSKYRELGERTKKKLIYAYIEKSNFVLGYRQIISLINPIRDYLRSALTKRLDLPYNLSIYKSYDYFYVDYTFTIKEYSYELHNKKKYFFKEVSVDLSDLSILNIKETDFPLTVRNVNAYDIFSTNIVNKDVVSFIKKNKVPEYMRNSYPVIVSKRGTVIYCPFFSNMKEHKSPVMLNLFLL